MDRTKGDKQQTILDNFSLEPFSVTLRKSDGSDVKTELREKFKPIVSFRKSLKT